MKVHVLIYKKLYIFIINIKYFKEQIEDHLKDHIFYKEYLKNNYHNIYFQFTQMIKTLFL